MLYPKPEIYTGHRAAVYGLSSDTAHTLYSADGAGMLVKWPTGQTDGLLIAQGNSPWYACTVLPETGEVVAGNLAGEIWWVNPSAVQVTGTIMAHQKGVFGLFPLHNGLVSLGGDGVMHFWQGKIKTSSIKLSHATLRGIAKHPKLNLIAVAASDAQIYLVDSESFSVVKVIVGAHEPSVFVVTFSACGKFLISGGRDAHLCIWAIDSAFELLHRIPAHHYTINDILFAPDGFSFFTASRDRSIKQWDVTDFRLLKVMDAARYSVHTASVNRLSWHLGKLWSVSDDKRLVCWL
jgi:WD40 repeat protein